MNPRDDIDLRHLMMAALDGELEPSQVAELEREIAADADLASEWQRLQQLKELTQMSTIKSPPKEQWDSYWHGVYNRLERGLGWILVSLGATVLLCYGVWFAVDELFQGLWADDSVPLLIKLAIFALGAGGAVLLVSIVREKLFTHRHDPYKEVER